MMPLFSLVLIARLYSLTVLDRAFLQHQGDARSLRTITIPSFRGMIIDRQGEPLAISTPVQCVLWGLVLAHCLISWPLWDSVGRESYVTHVGKVYSPSLLFTTLQLSACLRPYEALPSALLAALAYCVSFF